MVSVVPLSLASASLSAHSRDSQRGNSHSPSHPLLHSQSPGPQPIALGGLSALNSLLYGYTSRAIDPAARSNLFIRRCAMTTRASRVPYVTPDTNQP